MPKTKILQEGQSYTFRSYFEMPYEADEILAEFGYSFSKVIPDVAVWGVPYARKTEFSTQSPAEPVHFLALILYCPAGHRAQTTLLQAREVES